MWWTEFINGRVYSIYNVCTMVCWLTGRRIPASVTAMESSKNFVHHWWVYSRGCRQILILFWYFISRQCNILVVHYTHQLCILLADRQKHQMYPSVSALCNVHTTLTILSPIKGRLLLWVKWKVTDSSKRGHETDLLLITQRSSISWHTLKEAVSPQNGPDLSIYQLYITEQGENLSPSSVTGLSKGLIWSPPTRYSIT